MVVVADSSELVEAVSRELVEAAVITRGKSNNSKTTNFLQKFDMFLTLKISLEYDDMWIGEGERGVYN